MTFVAIKIGRRQGARRARICRDTQPTSNAAAGLFSSQPFGPRSVSCFSALLTPHVSMQICSSLGALKNSQLTSGESHAISGTGHYEGENFLCGHLCVISNLLSDRSPPSSALSPPKLRSRRPKTSDERSMARYLALCVNGRRVSCRATALATQEERKVSSAHQHLDDRVSLAVPVQFNSIHAVHNWLSVSWRIGSNMPKLFPEHNRAG